MTKKSNVLEVSDVFGLQEVIDKIKKSNEAWARKNGQKWGLEGLKPVWNNCVKTTIQLDTGIKNMLNANDDFKRYVMSGKKAKVSCLDLGAGMCQLGPVLRHLGFHTYVAIDLYTLRKQKGYEDGVRLSLDCAKQMFADLQGCTDPIIQEDIAKVRQQVEADIMKDDELDADLKEVAIAMIPHIVTQKWNGALVPEARASPKQMFANLQSDGYFIIEGDVSNARQHIESEVDDFAKHAKFDLIVSAGTEYSKRAGNKGNKREGIPDKLFNNIKEDLLHPNGFSIRFDAYEQIDYEKL